MSFSCFVFVSFFKNFEVAIFCFLPFFVSGFHENITAFLLRLFYAILFLFAFALASRTARARVAAVPIEREYGRRPHMETGSASLEPFLAAPRKMRVPAQVVPVGGNSATLSEGKLLVLVDSRDTACPLFSVRDTIFFSFCWVMLWYFPAPTLAAVPLGKRTRWVASRALPSIVHTVLVRTVLCR